MNNSRRNFLSGLALGSCGALNLPLLANAAQKPAATGKPKNIIMLVSDGLGMGALSACNYLQQQLYKQNSSWQSLYARSDLPLQRCWQHTRSANALVTDSAAAASAWGCGQRVNNGQLNVSPDGSKLRSLAQKFKVAGKSVGLLTSCEFTHATPAGFAVQADSRADSKSIAEQYLQLELDLLMGGGAKVLEKHPQLAKDYAHHMQVVGDSEALLQAKADKPLLACFTPSHLPYALDRKNSAKIPALDLQLRVALQRLAANPRGFFLLCEAGRVDHAAHANDACSLFYEQLEFNNCIKQALEFYGKNPEDTLIVITSDHGTAGLQLDGMGDNYLQSNRLILNIPSALHSFEYAAEKSRNAREFMQQLELAHPCSAFVKNLRKLDAEQLAGTGQLERGHYNAGLLGQIGQQAYALGWTNTAHCAEAVEVLMLGNTAVQLPLQIDNYQLHDHLVQGL